MIRINNIKLSPDEGREVLEGRISEILGTSQFDYRIERESLDARRRGGRHQLVFNYAVIADLHDPAKEKALARKKNLKIWEEKPVFIPQASGRAEASGRPVIAGFGPAGLFAAYYLAQEGYRPIVLERGDAVEERRRKVEAFRAGRAPLDPESNVQFGEGGAGTFSDGKLTSRSKDPLSREVKKIFVRHGAPEDILYAFEPHIGTDLLSGVVASMRKEIIRLGGDVHFNTALRSLDAEPGTGLKRMETSAGTLEGPLFLAIGHSARDTFRMLISAGLRAEAKDFAVGFRIEHDQDWINRRQYGEYAGHPRLGAASYRVHSRFYEGRNAYSFCMCPGGRVIAAASGPCQAVTNGMSYHARDGECGNSAILTAVKAGRDFADAPEAGILFQEEAEARAFQAGGGGAFAPVMRLGAFFKEAGLAPRKARVTTREPSYLPGVNESSLAGIYPEKITRAIARGIAEIDDFMPGFGGENIWLTGAESRSSSPVRFRRDPESREAEDFPGIYPIGEGAGYAGGIISAAADGLRSALRFSTNYKPASR